MEENIYKRFYYEMCRHTETVRRKTYLRNQIIFERDVKSDGMYYIIKGMVKIFSLMSDGSERSFTILSSPNVFGESETFDEGPRMVSAKAYGGETEIVCWTKSEIMEVISRHPDMASLIIRILASKLRCLTFREEDFMSRSLECRICNILIHHDRYMLYPGQADTYICITHDELANIIGSTRVKVTEKLKKLSKMGFIKTERGKIKIYDMDGLRKYLSILEGSC